MQGRGVVPRQAHHDLGPKSRRHVDDVAYQHLAALRVFHAIAGGGAGGSKVATSSEPTRNGMFAGIAVRDCFISRGQG
jgi:hypothetical protein